MNKLIVISAPSGAGKTSIVKHLLKNMDALSFSVSACSRDKRENETEGKDYHFLGVEDFKKKIKEDVFLEWEEVYENQFYGTLKSEVQRVWNEGKVVVFDVDVAGGLNIKKQYTQECLSIFIMPPSVDVLRERLGVRGTESEETLDVRISKSEEEISRNSEFDKVILNDDFEIACEETQEVISNFIKS